MPVLVPVLCTASLQLAFESVSTHCPQSLLYSRADLLTFYVTLETVLKHSERGINRKLTKTGFAAPKAMQHSANFCCYYLQVCHPGHCSDNILKSSFTGMQKTEHFSTPISTHWLSTAHWWGAATSSPHLTLPMPCSHSHQHSYGHVPASCSACPRVLEPSCHCGIGLFYF